MVASVGVSGEAARGPLGYDPSGRADVPPFGFLLVKLASRCNINCTYCYWFRDAEVYRKPAVMTVESEDALCARLEEHIRAYDLPEFTVVFHGGEPLLFPKRRFVALQKKLDEIQERTDCFIGRGVCTNGILVDEEWARILQEHDVQVTISLDGPAEIHAKYRVDMKGRGTHAETLQGLANLRASGQEPNLIVVCNPASDPEQVLRHVVDDLGVTNFDILPPDATHKDDPPPIDGYFIKLFDIWYDKFAPRGVRIRTLDAMMRGLLGDMSLSDTVGLGAVETVTLMTDGTLEPLDVLRIIGDGSTKTDSSVHANPIQDVQNDPRWRAAFEASTRLCDTCLACEYLDACGGGHLSQRWSPERGFDNPSVYCQSWKNILGHIWARVSPTLIVDTEENEASLVEAGAPAREQ
jgi:uncharacterized protein